jgi:hypothetical protein
MPENHPLWGTAFSVSSPETAERIQEAITDRGDGVRDLKDATVGFGSEYRDHITQAITNHIQISGKDHPELPIILVFDHEVGSPGSISDPREFTADDYVLVVTNNRSTALNTSIMPGIYRVTAVNGDNLTVVPATISAGHDIRNIKKNHCALLRTHIVNGILRIIIMVLEYQSLASSGGAKSSRRRKMTRRPSRSKSVNKKRKYTQQRVRRRSHRR